MIIETIIFLGLLVLLATVAFSLGMIYGQHKERGGMAILEQHEREEPNQKDAPFEIPIDDAKGGEK